MEFTPHDTLCMERALQLAAAGLGNVSPNPMVGAVITAPDGRVIGEGYHRRYGQAHAEVNAIKSVQPQDRHLLTSATIYVTLEPCAHYGKTPPCALLIRNTGIPHVVVGAVDPFARVDGRGIEILREAGCNVRTGLLADQSRSLNARFFTAHTHHRPFVTLKWACSADGYMDHLRTAAHSGAMQFSGPAGKVMVHRLRANHDAIAIGAGTVLADNPRLDVRHWTGRNPQRVIVDRHGLAGPATGTFAQILEDLYTSGVTSVMVEGGSSLLHSIIRDGLWDLARQETAPVILGAQGTAPAPRMDSPAVVTHTVGANTVRYYSNNPLVNPYFIENGL